MSHFRQLFAAACEAVDSAASLDDALDGAVAAVLDVLCSGSRLIPCRSGVSASDAARTAAEKLSRQ